MEHQVIPGEGAGEQQPSWKKYLQYLVLSLILFHLLNVSLSPLRTLNEYSRMVSSDSILLAAFDASIDHPLTRPLLIERIRKEAQLSLSADDSISLAVSLSDSTVRLMIEGVTIHRSKAGSLSADRIIRRMPALQVIELFSAPLTVTSQRASIEKEPVVVVHAPAIGTEPDEEEWQPDTTRQVPVFVSFTLRHNIKLLMLQEVNKPGELVRLLMFRSGGWIKKQASDLLSTLRFRRIYHYPRITVRIPADELKAIYRALPSEPKVIVSIL